MYILYQENKLSQRSLVFDKLIRNLKMADFSFIFCLQNMNNYKKKLISGLTMHFLIALIYKMI